MKHMRKKCEEVRAINNELLTIFEKDLTDSGLSIKTINSHISNVDFYINEFLLREGVNYMLDGVGMVDSFPGNFFIRKCMWSTPANIKTTAASIKKFYKCMLDHEKIKKQDYDYLCYEIKFGMPVWQETCEVYNDPEQPNPFYFF